MRKNTQKVIIILLFVIFIGVLVVGKIKDKEKHSSTSSTVAVTKDKESSNTSDATKDEKKDDSKNTENKNSNLSPYEKINKKQGISMLFLGDKILKASSLNEEDKIDSNIKKWIEDTYAIKVDKTTKTSDKGFVSSSLEDYNSLENKKYDLVVLCTGEFNLGYEPNKKIIENYESIIKKIKENNEKASIYIIIEGSIQTDKNFPTSLNNLAEKYKLNSIDLREDFVGAKAGQLTVDGIIPNEAGYKIYKDNLEQAITKSIEDNKSN